MKYGFYRSAQREKTEFVEIFNSAQDVFFNILMWWEEFDGKTSIPTIPKPRPLWTGKQIFTLIIPKQITLMRQAFWHPDAEVGDLSPGDTEVRIEEGEVLAGTLWKQTLGTGKGSLIHVTGYVFCSLPTHFYACVLLS